MAVLQTNLSSDHNFATTTPSSTAGYHTVVHMVTSANDPAIIAGVGQVYTKVENGVANLYYRAGDGPGTITRLSNPGLGSYTQRAVDSSSYTAGQKKSVYFPGNDFTAIVWAIIPSTGKMRAAICTSVNNSFSNVYQLYTVGSPVPTISMTGRVIEITNPTAGNLTILHSIMSNITP